MYSHCDSSFRELMRDKLASLFRKEIKEEVIGQSSSKKMKDEAPRGVFGGDKVFVIKP